MAWWRAVAQMVQRVTPCEEVVGSIPAVAARSRVTTGWVGCQYNVTGWDRSHGLPALSRV